MSLSLGRINWRRLAVAAVLLLLAGMLLGATVFREQVAQAAQLLQVQVANSPSSPVPVSQQGKADVNVTNPSLTVKPPAPVTSGGQRFSLGPGRADLGDPPQTASALVIQFRDGASELIFYNDDRIVARFPGPGPLVLPLPQPIQFDAVDCGGPAGSECDFGWAGSAG